MSDDMIVVEEESLLERALAARKRKRPSKATAAKRKLNGEKARELYASFESLSGSPVSQGKRRGRLHVTLGRDAAHVNISWLKKIVVKTPRGQDVRWKDVGTQGDGWSAWFDGANYVCRRRGGPEKAFGDQDDLEEWLIKQLSPMLEEE